ncbi:hypothetical protein QQA05_00250 [Corynebacterium macclintockiae]|uniref:hypothetical protein n=1 Tax=Corynebacterium macclintockiae TaxID=2913501 RepID=UPI00254EF8C5|nr:hypothetical protein [Corynebacterium macclintockiae]MDK8889845.1 hypothetical protein [Corynebacterium macclintockiae]
MATKKTTSVAKTSNTEVDVVDGNGEKREPVFADGIYTEYGVELTNGAKVDVEVIVDKRKLPASYGLLLSEGNGPAIIMATLTTRTRRFLDWAGATLDDIEDVLPGVISRGQEFSEDS